MTTTTRRLLLRFEPRHGVGRRVARMLCAAFALVGLLPVAGLVLARTEFAQAWASQRAMQLLEQETGLRGTFEASVGTWPVSLQIRNLVIDGTDGAGAAVRADRVTVRPRLAFLLQGVLTLGDVELDRPSVRLVVREGKVMNLALRSPPAKTDRDRAVSSPFASVAVNAASLDIDVDGVRVRAGEVDADVTGEDGPSFDVAIRSGPIQIDRSSWVTYTGTGAPQATYAFHEDRVCALDTRLRVEPSTIRVRRLRVTGAADLDPAVDGGPPCAVSPEDVRRVEIELRAVRARLDDDGLAAASGEVHARGPARLANRFVSFLPLEGWVSVDASGSWKRGQRAPDLRANVTGSGIELGIYRLASDLSAEVRLEDGQVEVPKMDVGFADGRVHATDVVIRPFEAGAPLQATEVSVHGLRLEALMRDLGVTDRAHVRMRFQDGRFASVHGTLEPLAIDSDLLTQVSDFEVFDKAFNDPARSHMIGVSEGTVRSRFAVRPNAVEFQNATARFGQSQLHVFVSLGFANEFRLDLAKGSRVELADVSPLVDIEWKGAAQVTGQITGTFGEPRIRSDLSVERFEFADMVLGDITQANVEFRPMVLDLRNVQAIKGHSAYGIPSMSIEFDGAAAVLARANVSTTRFDIRDFLGVFRMDEDPRFDGIVATAQARASFEYELGGARDRCGGGWLGLQTHVKLKDIELFDERYDEGEVELAYEWVDPAAQELGVRADIQSAVLRKAGGTILGSGTIREGGVIQARAVATGVPLHSLQALGGVGPLLEGSVSATAEVSGTIHELEAQLDARLPPVRIGRTWMPASELQVRLRPADGAARMVGHTKCHHPISAPFDLAEYQQDRSEGTFHVNGALFGGQILLQDLGITRQRHKVVTGHIEARDFRIDGVSEALAGIVMGAEVPRGTLSGRLALRHVELDALDRSDVSMDLTGLHVQNESAAVQLREGTPAVTLRDNQLTIPNIRADFRSQQGLSGTVTAKGSVAKVMTDPVLDLTGELPWTDLSHLGTIFPQIERAAGQLQAVVSVRGKMSDPRFDGHMTVKDGALSVRDSRLSLDQVGVTVHLTDREIRLVRASARMGGGTIEAQGTIPMSGFDLGAASARVSARGVALPMQQGVSATVDADLAATWAATADAQGRRSPPRIIGDVTLQSFEYTKPFGVSAELTTLAQKAKRTEFEAYDPAEDFVEFEIQLHAGRALQLRNNLAELQLVVEPPGLTVSGTNQRAGVRGSLRVTPGGRLRLRSNEFEVREGVVRFDDSTRVSPTLDITAVTQYRRYSAAQASSAGAAAPGASATSAGVSATGGQWRIELHAYGDTDNLRLDLTSEPPLSQEDIVLLLTFGVTRAELDQMQAAGLGESAAVEALSGITGADTAVRETIPVIDDFRLGSGYSARSGRTEPNVTVGKRLSERVRATVTSGMSDSSEVRSSVEWELTRKTSLLGSYDSVNNVSNSTVGNLGADIRFRITFE